MKPSYAIRLTKEPFVFSAAHFITYAGDVCERLHGHNYRVAVEITGPLDENAYVLDFVATRDAVAAITAQLDHRVLLPTEHPLIRVEETTSDTGQAEVMARFEERRWVFPAEDCKRLPLANTTAELLAQWIGEQLLAELRGQGARIESLAIEVDECEGQIGVCRLK